MTKIRVIKESETEKSKQSFSIVIRSADESVGPSSIQIIRDARVVESPSLAPGVSSLFHTHRAEQAKELSRMYDLMKEELDVVVEGVDDVIENVQITIVEETLHEAQQRALKLSGSFTGKFTGDGAGLKNLRWENIIGKRNRPGAGGAIFPTALITASFAVSSSFAETASFAQNAATASFIDPLPSASLASGSLVPGRGIEITVSGSSQIIESDKESFVTFA